MNRYLDLTYTQGVKMTSGFCDIYCVRLSGSYRKIFTALTLKGITNIQMHKKKVSQIIK